MKHDPLCPTHRADLWVLALIAGGLIAILLSIIAGLFFSSGAAALPNWAENVLIGIATAAGLKLGDALSALVALATGRQVGELGSQLAASAPLKQSSPPRDAVEGAEKAAEAASDVAENLADQAGQPDPRTP